MVDGAFVLITRSDPGRLHRPTWRASLSLSAVTDGRSVGLSVSKPLPGTAPAFFHCAHQCLNYSSHSSCYYYYFSSFRRPPYRNCTPGSQSDHMHAVCYISIKFRQHVTSIATVISIYNLAKIQHGVGRHLGFCISVGGLKSAENYVSIGWPIFETCIFNSAVHAWKYLFHHLGRLLGLTP